RQRDAAPLPLAERLLLPERHAAALRQFRIEKVACRGSALQIRIPEDRGGDFDRVEDTFLAIEAVFAARARLHPLILLRAHWIGAVELILVERRQCKAAGEREVIRSIDRDEVLVALGA